MIGRLSGTLLEKNPPHVLVDCAGVGYEVDVPMSTLYGLPDTGGKVVLFTQLIVREDAHLLYGFGTTQEREALPAHQNFRRRAAHCAGGVVRHVGGRTRASGNDAGGRALDQGAGHRQKNR